MAMRIPFFGLISLRSPLLGLLEHYEQIAIGMALIEESMECYISGGGHSGCKEFDDLQREVNAVEEKADVIKRYIRNHLPRGIFLPVDKHIFFSYTRQQDDILDAGQASLQWLAMRDVLVPEAFQRELIYFLDAVSTCVKMLKPAIEDTIACVNDEGVEREDVKQRYREVRAQHKKVTDMMHRLDAELYRSSMDFKDIYQLIHFVEKLHSMSHSAEGCADLLRVMLAK
jgi:predicted phosphate transport protein (TIGR00153 family)